MSKRITIMIDDDLHAKLHNRQAKLIAKEHTSISFSKVLNQAIRKSIK